MKKFSKVILILIAITAYLNIGYYFGARVFDASIKVAKSKKLSVGEKFLLNRESQVLVGKFLKNSNTKDSKAEEYYGFLSKKRLKKDGMKAEPFVIFRYSIFWPFLILLNIVKDLLVIILIVLKFIFFGGFAQLFLK